MFLCPVAEPVYVSGQDTGPSDLFQHCRQIPGTKENIIMKIDAKKYCSDR